jgi:hypothetical protein
MDNDHPFPAPAAPADRRGPLGVVIKVLRALDESRGPSLRARP